MVAFRLTACQAAVLAALTLCTKAQLPPAPASGPVLGTGGNTVALAVQDGSCAGNGIFQVKEINFYPLRYGFGWHAGSLVILLYVSSGIGVIDGRRQLIKCVCLPVFTEIDSKLKFHHPED